MYLTNNLFKNLEKLGINLKIISDHQNSDGQKIIKIAAKKSFGSSINKPIFLSEDGQLMVHKSTIKYGRFLSAIGLTNQKLVKQLVEKMRQYFELLSRLNIVQVSSNIEEVYNLPHHEYGEIGHSCMKRKGNFYQYFTLHREVFGEVLAKIAYIVRHDEIIGRAILWDNVVLPSKNLSIKLMDRIYFEKEETLLLLKTWAFAHGYWIKERQSIRCLSIINNTGDIWDIEGAYIPNIDSKLLLSGDVPFMDTFLAVEDNKLVAYHDIYVPEGLPVLRTTSGIYYISSGYTEEDWDNNWDDNWENNEVIDESTTASFIYSVKRCSHCNREFNRDDIRVPLFDGLGAICIQCAIEHYCYDILTGYACRRDEFTVPIHILNNNGKLDRIIVPITDIAPEGHKFDYNRRTEYAFYQLSSYYGHRVYAYYTELDENGRHRHFPIGCPCPACGQPITTPKYIVGSNRINCGCNEYTFTVEKNIRTVALINDKATVSLVSMPIEDFRAYLPLESEIYKINGHSYNIFAHCSDIIPVILPNDSILLVHRNFLSFKTISDWKTWNYRVFQFDLI